jgi:hypothetical protein
MKHPNRICRDAKRFSFKARSQAMAKPDYYRVNSYRHRFATSQNAAETERDRLFAGWMINTREFLCCNEFDITNEPVLV